MRARQDNGGPLCHNVPMWFSVRRTASTLAAVGIALTACGTAEEAVPDTAGEPAATTAATAQPVEEPDLTESESAAEAPVASDSAPTPVDETPAPTDPPAAPVPEAVIGGRALASELSAASDFSENALPDIQVDDIRRGMKVTLRNVFPAERPVLLWLWAPH
jgi:hypothetical protein